MPIDFDSKLDFTPCSFNFEIGCSKSGVSGSKSLGFLVLVVVGFEHENCVKFGGGLKVIRL